MPSFHIKSVGRKVKEKVLPSSKPVGRLEVMVTREVDVTSEHLLKEKEENSKHGVGKVLGFAAAAAVGVWSLSKEEKRDEREEKWEVWSSNNWSIRDVWSQREISPHGTNTQFLPRIPRPDQTAFQMFCFTTSSTSFSLIPFTPNNSLSFLSHQLLPYASLKILTLMKFTIAVPTSPPFSKIL